MYRSTSESGPWALVNGSIHGNAYNYTDSGLINGNTYYYKVLAITNTSVYTGYSNVISVTPKLDVTAPDGWVMARNNIKETNSTRINLEAIFAPGTDVQFIQVSDTPSFDTFTSFSIGDSIFYDINPVFGLHLIYLRFIDYSGNIGGFHNSKYAFVGIYYTLPSSPTTSSTTSLTSTSSSTSAPIAFTTELSIILLPAILISFKRKYKK